MYGRRTLAVADAVVYSARAVARFAGALVQCSLLSLTVSMGASSASQSSTSYSIGTESIDSGGGETSSAGFRIRSTIGGAVGAGDASSASYRVRAGFQPLAAYLAAALFNPARLFNISTRGQVLTGNDVLIGGFVVGGVSPKTLVVRARGPSLAPFGINNAIADPTLDLYSGAAVIATNNDWGLSPNVTAIQASGFAPSNAKEAAILTTVSPGAYTAVVSGFGGTAGVGIVEVFEVDRPDVPLINISTRGLVLTGNDVMIGGFVIQGNVPQTVIIRARGPSLLSYGITNPLLNPQLQLFSGQTLIASNDDWGSAANSAQVQSSGFAPADPRESAILITLNPGAYTAVVTGANGGTGVGIVEVFAQ